MSLAGGAADPLGLAGEWPIDPAVPAPAFLPWCCATGEHAQVWTTTSPDLARACAAYVDAFQACVCASLEAPLPGTSPVTLVVFAQEAAYNRYIAVQLPAGIIVKEGYFSSALQQSLLLLVPSLDRHHAFMPMVTLRHEITHQLLQRLVGAQPIPPWLDEGLACCCSYWEPGDDRATNLAASISRVGRDRGNYFISQLVRSVGTDSFIPLRRLVATSYSGFHVGGWDEGQFYCESWALCEFMLSTRPGRALIATMLAMLKDGQGIDYRNLGYDLDALATEWDLNIRTRMLPQ